VRRAKSPSAFHADVHRLQLELFSANRRLINDAVEESSDELRRYEARYRRTVRGVKRPVSFDALLSRTRAARAILVGDYHTLPQAQRAFFRILRKQPKDANIVVALEMLAGSREQDIARFIDGELSEETFLKRVDHARRWPFGALDAVRPIFELCRAKKYRLIGLDIDEPGKATLAERDQYAAEKLVQAIETTPGARVFALIGELHLAPSHLPRAIERELLKKQIEGDVLRVHQNPERIWFEQNAVGVPDEHDVLELDDGSLAVLSASPVVCQQSFLTWLEHVQEGSLEPELDGDVQSRGFEQAIRVLGRVLELPIEDAVKEVEIVGPADLGFFSRLSRSKKFNKQELKNIRAHVLRSESSYIPRARLVYLATLSINHAAEEASHYLRHHLSGEGEIALASSIDAFYGRVINEAIGFLGSKIVNPKRKQSAFDADALDPEIVRYVDAHKKMERGEHVPWLSQVFSAPTRTVDAVTHHLGYLLGDQLYYALVRGKLSRKDARDLYFRTVGAEGAALLWYLELIAKVGNVTLPKRD
jgi:hypothetical protein